MQTALQVLDRDLQRWGYLDVLGTDVAWLLSAYMKRLVSFCISDLQMCSQVLQTRYLWLCGEAKWFVLEKICRKQE